MEINYRKITDKDAPFLREMLYEALFVPEKEPPFPLSIIDHPDISKYSDHWGREGDFGIIALDKELKMGALWGRLFPMGNKGYGFVDNKTPEISMAVLNNYRNIGIGTGLMNYFIQHARDLGYRKISLSVDKRSKAVNFYKRAGFEIYNEYKTAYTMLISNI